jgi:hypothetical protein
MPYRLAKKRFARIEGIPIGTFARESWRSK